MKKKILIAVGVIVLLVVVGLVVVAMNLDRIVRAATEKVMTYVLQVDCKVGSAAVKVREGSIEFRDIVIPNPSGYNTDNAMKFGLVKAQVDIGSFRTEEPIVRLVQLSQAEITMEARKGGSNLQDLINNASRLSGGKEGQPKEPQPTEPQPREAGKAIKIQKVLLEENKVRVAIPFLGGETFTVPLPTIELNDLGGKDKGATPAEAMQEVLAGILTGIKNAGAQILPADVLADIGKTLKELPANIQQSVGEVGKQAQEATQEVGKQAQQAATQAEETVKQAGTQAQEAAKQAGSEVQKAAGEASKAAGELGSSVKGLLGSKKPQPTPTAAPTKP